MRRVAIPVGRIAKLLSHPNGVKEAAKLARQRKTRATKAKLLAIEKERKYGEQLDLLEELAECGELHEGVPILIHPQNCLPEYGPRFYIDGVGANNRNANVFPRASKPPGPDRPYGVKAQEFWFNGSSHRWPGGTSIASAWDPDNVLDVALKIAKDWVAKGILPE